MSDEATDGQAEALIVAGVSSIKFHPAGPEFVLADGSRLMRYEDGVEYPSSWEYRPASSTPTESTEEGDELVEGEPMSVHYQRCIASWITAYKRVAAERDAALSSLKSARGAGRLMQAMHESEPSRGVADPTEGNVGASKNPRVEQSARRVVERYGDVLERLADAPVAVPERTVTEAFSRGPFMDTVDGLRSALDECKSDLKKAETERDEARGALDRSCDRVDYYRQSRDAVRAEAGRYRECLVSLRNDFLMPDDAEDRVLAALADTRTEGPKP